MIPSDRTSQQTVRRGGPQLHGEGGPRLQHESAAKFKLGASRGLIQKVRCERGKGTHVNYLGRSFHGGHSRVSKMSCTCHS